MTNKSHRLEDECLAPIIRRYFHGAFGLDDVIRVVIVPGKQSVRLDLTQKGYHAFVRKVRAIESRLPKGVFLGVYDSDLRKTLTLFRGPSPLS